MCTGITVTRRYVPHLQRTNLCWFDESSGLKYMQLLLWKHHKHFQEVSDFQKTLVFKGWIGTTLVPGDYMYYQGLTIFEIQEIKKF